MAVSSANEQREIRMAITVIRRWLHTIRHDLCLQGLPTIEICKPRMSIYNAPAAGQAIPGEARVRIFLQRNGGTEDEYLRTLAHELRHLFQYQNGIPATERDCEEYEQHVLQRFKNGPTDGVYDGRIEGISVVRRCPRCRAKAPDDGLCSRCQARDAEQAGRAAEIERARLAAERATKKRRDAAEQKQSAESRLRQKEIDWWRENVDNHPDNGNAGYWLVNGLFYVPAKSAGEALIKVAGQLDSKFPKIKFIGSEAVRGSIRER
jgi:hypothetical protein